MPGYLCVRMCVTTGLNKRGKYEIFKTTILILAGIGALVECGEAVLKLLFFVLLLVFYISPISRTCGLKGTLRSGDPTQR